uniref:Uncharacterized protein n=1 Tax=Thermus caliditerrae TaxID=1330700 RepID=A0A7C5REZ6_9DEIN
MAFYPREQGCYEARIAWAAGKAQDKRKGIAIWTRPNLFIDPTGYLLLGGRALELLLRASREARRGPVGLDRLPSAYFLWDRALLRGGADVPKALLPLVGIPREPVLLPDPIGKVKEVLEGLDAELWEGVRLEVAVVRGQRVVLAGWMGGSAQALIVHFSLGKIP